VGDKGLELGPAAAASCQLSVPHREGIGHEEPDCDELTGQPPGRDQPRTGDKGLMDPQDRVEGPEVEIETHDPAEVRCRGGVAGQFSHKCHDGWIVRSQPARVIRALLPDRLCGPRRHRLIMIPDGPVRFALVRGTQTVPDLSIGFEA
jgi:hypothetical protein